MDSDQITIDDLICNAIEFACREEQSQPTLLLVLWSFGFGAALILFRDGAAHRAAPDTWSMGISAVDQIWLPIQRGMNRYIRVCEDVTRFNLPEKDDFFLLNVPNALAVASDVRLVREQTPADILAVMTEKLGDELLASEASTLRMMMRATRYLFWAVGTELPAP